MNELTRITIDTSKAVFTLHGVDAAGQVVLRRNLRRRELLPFFAKLPALALRLHHAGLALSAFGTRKSAPASTFFLNPVIPPPCRIIAAIGLRGDIRAYGSTGSTAISRSR
jgi:hypothetical protein